MNSPRLTPPQPPSDAPSLSLDARIRRVELRLIAREEGLHQGLHTVRLQVQAAVRPWRRALPLAGAALVAAGVWAWTRRGGAGASLPPFAARPAAAAGGRPPARTAAPDVPWLRMAALAWPLLPAAWRSSISPATASAVVGLGLPLAERLLGRGPQRPPVTPVPQVDLVRWAGPWQLVAHLPGRWETGCADAPVARYTPLRDGTLSLQRRCTDAHGRVRWLDGRAQPIPGSHGSRWRVSFWPGWLLDWAWAWDEHCVLHVDEHYREALVGSASRDTLWLLSRRAVLPRGRVLALVQIAQDQGYDVQRLHWRQG